jgi:outer membrane protein OmpA-like peptidoglycan-associated protein
MQTAPTPTEIMRALLPTPKALQSTRGLPAPGVAARPGAGNDHPAKVSLDFIWFGFDSARLKPESIEALRNLGNALNHELKDQKLFLIEGHTDAAGGRQYNALLSDRRAETVKDFLVREMSVSPDRLGTVAKGSSELADPKHPFAAENRRVVIVNLGG